MNPKIVSSSLCWRRRQSIFSFNNPDLWTGSRNATIPQITRRGWSNKATERPTESSQNPASSAQHRHPPRRPFKWPSELAKFSVKRKALTPVPRAPGFVKQAQRKPPPNIDPDNVQAYFENHVKDWIHDPATRERIVSFGIPEQELQPLLDTFATAVESGSFSTPQYVEYYDLQRFGQPLTHGSSVSVIYSTIFFAWAAHPAQRQLLEKEVGIQPLTISHITRLTEATDRLYLAEEYTEARRIHRKVIMHVGPTNSGKTHHALRALAAAKIGVYAGPLRLLAHEIWERLNLGQIVPSGVEEPPIKNEPEPNSLFDDTPDTPAVRNTGNPQYARLCNMITGEEHKIVDESAPLLSCTVEMLSYRQSYDVAVVDEIQMLADPARGSGWTNAVLGLCAKELHLCGEETAVPIVEALLQNTGDELVVNRYNRLTPLVVEDQSLNGDFSKVQKGDCIVAFSRSGIFAIKRKVEEATGLRCAVVYGRLPPEIRSEQATLFNDPGSGYDVLVGSDAIGMGLNLKIRRVVFDAVTKFDSQRQKYLSVSQVKQIAGRAGRFGLQGNDEPGGFTTTLHEADLSFLRSAITSPFESLPYARLSHDTDSFTRLFNLLPPKTTPLTILEAHSYVGRLPHFVRYSEDTSENAAMACAFIDENAGQLTNREWVTHLNAPIAWRDPLLVDVYKNFLEQQRNNFGVQYLPAIKSTRFMETMEAAEAAMANGRVPRSNVRDLGTLESFHKSLVLYIWMSYRSPVMYSEYDVVSELKERLERVLQRSLEALSSKAHLNASTSHRPFSWAASKARIPYRNKRRRDDDASLQPDAPQVSRDTPLTSPH